MSDDTLQQAKAAMRKTVRDAILALDRDTRAGMDHHICTHLLTSCEFQCSEGILLYCSRFSEEIDTRPLVAGCVSAHKRLYLPRTAPGESRLKISRIDDPETQLVPGYCDIPEPLADLPEADLAEADLIIVPGLAFDQRGFRLGRGGGYYDRLLSLASHDPFTVGLAYEVQIVPEVPRIATDRPVRTIMTQERVIRAGTGARP